jgi:hypothetical protein
MNADEKAIARLLFKNKILSTKGQAFEDLFSAIMTYAYTDFQQIKPWGNIGDRKNDGYRKTNGIFYQVYAPEDAQRSYPSLVKKLKTDFTGLKRQWSPVNEFYFVLNDRYSGVNADCEIMLQDIKNSHNLTNAGFLTAKDLENILFNLTDDQIFSITGFILDPTKIKSLDYSILNEVILHIMQLPLTIESKPGLVPPNWDDKIKFNGLSKPLSDLLNVGYWQINSLEAYLKNNSNFLADSLRDKMNGIYLQESKYQTGDSLFWAIVNCASPKNELMYQTAVIVIMSKYFETCDIFEEPPMGKAK